MEANHINTIIDGHEMEVPAHLMPVEPVRAAHTETPWRGQIDGVFLHSDWSADKSGASSTCSAPIVDSRGKTVALVVIEGWNESELEANAAFIVTACNGWNDIEALRKRLVELESK